MNDIKAIPTVYNGYKFRSRLEARWAVYFDALGIEWEYEKEGYELKSGWYLPDFWLKNLFDRNGRLGVWVEIKGEIPTSKESDLCGELAEGTQHPVLLFWGLPSDVQNDQGGYWWGFYEEKTGGVGSCWDNCISFHHCCECGATKTQFRNDYFECFKCGNNSSTYENEKTIFAELKAKQADFREREV